ncbi:SCO6881 family protein [Streptomyces hainanensis]|uniref:ATP-binding protein n=1 Tax=Streptomyces hainanensis TaxID=402648 RepID=A0A4R4TBX2_9ACTN|nr:ATP-binding protein [Streptomyces hainanensis]TDC72612.1 ATP-binding protein [Streptomyces hainanensis]
MSVCDIPLVDRVCDSVTDMATGTAQAMTEGIGAWIATSMGDMAVSAADLAASAVDATTAVDLEARWFRDNYELLLPIGLITTVGAFCLHLVYAAWRQDGTAMRRALTGTISGILFAFVVIPLTMLGLGIVDALSAGLFEAAGTSLSDAVRRVVDVALLGPMFDLGWALATLMAIGLAVGAFAFWGVMILRKVGILILVTLAVFAGAGGGWDTARRWRRGWIEITATLVISKLLMTVIFLLGVSAMGESDPQGDGLAALSDALAGMVVMALVLVSPFATYRFVRWASDGGGEDLHRSGTAGVSATTRSAQQAAGVVARAKTGGVAPQGTGGMAPQGPAGWSGSPAGGIVPANTTGRTTGRHAANGQGAGSPVVNPTAGPSGRSGGQRSASTGGGAVPLNKPQTQLKAANKPVPPPPPTGPRPEGDDA